MKRYFRQLGRLTAITAMLLFATTGSSALMKHTTTSDLPNFHVTASELTSTCETAIEAAKARFDALAKLADEERTFLNTVGGFNHIEADLGEHLNAVTFLKEVSTAKEVRDAAGACESQYKQFVEVDLYTREDLFNALKAYADKKERLGSSHRKMLDKKLIEFKRNGLFLPKAQREEVIALKKELIEKELAFQKNLSEYKDTLEVTKAELDGLSADFIEGLERTSAGKYKLTMSYPHYFPFMENAKDAKARERLLFKFFNRAANTNVAILEEILNLRVIIAHKLGYKTHAEYVLEDRMAKRPGKVEDFLASLFKKVAEPAKQQLADMLELKQKDDPKAIAITEADWRYYFNQVKKSRFKIDEQKIQEYFPLERVTKGMFDVYQTLFGVTFREVPSANAWHPEAELFKVTDNRTGDLIGHFYLDLFPRDNKYSHAAAWGLIEGRRLPNGSYRTPVGSMVANFTKPTKTKPSLLTHKEVETFFHEFGHIMHLLLSRPEYQQLSGYQVAWDFVEAPSQMLENWVWNTDVLTKISGHYKTGKPLPKETIQQMIAAKNLYSGIVTTRQIFLGMLNHFYHTHENVDTDAVMKDLWKKYRFIDMPEGTHFQASFGHLIEYDAAYYGYLWSEVFSADMFSRFEKEGVLNPDLGMEYRKAVLEPGASKDEMDLVVDFLGRKPNQKAFLKSIGLR